MMSRLIDDIVRSAPESISDFSGFVPKADYGYGRPGWLISKPIPGPFIYRLRDAIKVLRGKAEAIHYFEDCITK
jgi:hypothetical protein